MTEALNEVLGQKCELACGGDGQVGSLLNARIADGLLNAGLTAVNFVGAALGISGAYQAAVANLDVTNGEARRPGMEPAPAPVIRAEQENTLKPLEMGPR